MRGRQVHFEEVYADILQRAYLPPLRKPADNSHNGLLSKLQKAIGWFSLYRTEANKIECRKALNYLDIRPNAIAGAFGDIYDREIERSLGGLARSRFSPRAIRNSP